MAAPMAAADTAAPPPPPPPPAAEPAVQASLAPSDTAPPAAATDSPAPPPPAPAPPTAAADIAAPPPPPPPAPEPAVHMAAPTSAADTAAAPPPPPPPAPEPAVHMAAPTSAADTSAAPPPPPPAPELAAAKFSHALPPFRPHPDPPAPKRRKLEEAGFHTSPYYKIRATVADLRLRFIQVYEATDFRKSDAAREILREIKTVMELSKKMRLDLSASSEPVKPLEKPLVGAVKDEPTAPIIPSGERSQVPQAGQTAIPPDNANDGVPATQA